MKITIWTIACDDDTGTYAKVFATEDHAIQWLWVYVIAPELKESETIAQVKQQFDIQEALEHYTKDPSLTFPPSYNLEQHEFSLPNPSARVLLPINRD